MYHPTTKRAALAALLPLRRRRDELAEEIRILEQIERDQQKRTQPQASPQASDKRRTATA